jgi:NADH:ubiquinone oxidoreductase subunit F (NADH-binding)
LSGQETALVSQINGGLAKPTFIPPRPTTRGVRRQPTLILNVETLAHLALIARYGSDWYRELGSEREPGSRLVTLAGAIHNPGIYEIENGTPLDALFEAAGGLNDSLGSVLVGGYFGSWFTPAALENVALSNAALAQTGAGLGCAAVVALPANACVVAETVRVAIYLATETAHQCGPCVHGTAAIARALHEIGGGTAAASAYADINRWTTTLPGRGACHHPNGLAHFVASAVHNFRDQFTDHAHKGPCDDCSNHILPIPHS